MDISTFGQGSQYAYFPVSNINPSSKIGGDDQTDEETKVGAQAAVEEDKLQTSQTQEEQAKLADEEKDNEAGKAAGKKETDALTFYERELQKQQQKREERIEAMKEEKKEEERKEEAKKAEEEDAEKRKEMMEQQVGSRFIVENAGTVEGVKHQIGQEEDKTFQLNNGVIPTAGGASFTV